MALLASSLLFPLALADGTLFPRHDNYVNQTSLESFQDWLGTANASATHEVQFPNIYQDAYPGDPDDEVKHIIWLRIDDETHDTAEQANAGIHPGDAPHAISENGTLNVNDTWAVCPSVTRFRDHGLPRDVPINRNCSNVFPEDCLAWLRNLGSGGNMCINAALGNPSPWKDSPCDGALDGDSTPRVLEAHAGGHPNRLFNWTLFSAPQNGDNGDDRYDRFVDAVYLFTTSFARWDAEAGEVLVNSSDVRTEFTCLRADTFSKGSRTLEDIDAGVNLKVPFGWAVMVGAAAAMILTTGGI